MNCASAKRPWPEQRGYRCASVGRPEDSWVCRGQSLVVLLWLPQGSFHKTAARSLYIPLLPLPTAQYKDDSQPSSLNTCPWNFTTFQDLIKDLHTSTPVTRSPSHRYCLLTFIQCHQQLSIPLLYASHSESWLVGVRNLPPRLLEHIF